MAKFKIVVSDPDKGESKIVELDGTKAVPLLGRKMGEIIDGAVVGMSGSKLKITGGSDKDGFPMNANVHGGVRIRIIVSKSVGFHPKSKGERRRRTLRGNVITEDVVQINMKVIMSKKGEKVKTLNKANTKLESPEA